MYMQTREFSTQEHAQNNIQLEARGQLSGKNAVPFLMVDVLIRWGSWLASNWIFPSQRESRTWLMGRRVAVRGPGLNGLWDLIGVG
jgi:hypothetical protein